MISSDDSSAVNPAVGFLDTEDRAAAVLQPLRLRILRALREPDSASGLARKFRLPRQRVNYHVRKLARAGFLRRAGERRKGSMIERRYVATARSYVLSPELLSRLGGDAAEVEDRFSAAYLLALASRMQSEVAQAVRDAGDQEKRLATLSLSTDLRFASPEQRARFADELQRAILDMVGRFASPALQADGAPAPGRLYRLVLGCYPAIPKKDKHEEKAP